MRVFVGFRIGINDSLRRLHNDLCKASWANMHVVKPQNYHITILFIGNFEEKKMSVLTNVLNEVSGAILTSDI